MSNFDKINARFPNLKMDYLPWSDIPRLRILFPNKDVLAIKKGKDAILKHIYGNNKISTLIMFYSGNSKKMRKKDIEDIEVLGLQKFIVGAEKDIVHLEPNVFGYRYINSISFDETIRLTDILINNEDGRLCPSLPFLNAIVFLFDENFDSVINVYRFEGMDISSHNKNYLYRLRDIFRGVFEILDDRI